MSENTITIAPAEVLAGWKIRGDVTGVIGYWSMKIPSVHRVDAKCMKAWPDIEVMDRSWLEEQFAANLGAEETGQARTAYFCSRCVVESVNAVIRIPKSDLPSLESELELVKTPEQQAAWDRLNEEEAADKEAVAEEVVADKPLTARQKKAAATREAVATNA